jgi:hypothetical protein
LAPALIVAIEIAFRPATFFLSLRFVPMDRQ